MANVNPTVPATFDNVYQLEITDPNEAGPGGILNEQALALVNRTQYLLDQITEIKRYLPKNRGFAIGVDINNTPGTLSVGGDIVSASRQTTQSGQCKILFTMANSMGSGSAGLNYFVKISIQSLGTETIDVDNLGWDFKIINATSFYVQCAEAGDNTQNLKVHVEIISLN